MAHLPNASLETALNHDYTHPEKRYEGLVFSHGLDDKIHGERAKQGLWSWFSPNREQELCRSCGWSAYLEIYTAYDSRVKIMYARDNVGFWAIGSQWIIRDQPNDEKLGNDYMTQQFLRAQPGLNVPLIKEMRLLSQPTDQIHFTLMSRAQGVTLDSIWSTLTPEQKLGYKDQVVDFIRQIRQFTAPVPQKVDGSPLDDILIGCCISRHPPSCKKIGSTTEEWFEGMVEELRRGLSNIHDTDDPTIIEAKLQELKDNFPASEPYVLSHTDLHLANIIVKDGRIQAVLDWEMAGYYPWWAERWASIRWSNNNGYELYNSVWADIYPEMDTNAFFEFLSLHVQPVMRAFGHAQGDISHPGGQARLLRPAFCQCRPWAGSFKLSCIGQPYGHELKEKRAITPLSESEENLGRSDEKSLGRSDEKSLGRSDEKSLGRLDEINLQHDLTSEEDN